MVYVVAEGIVLIAPDFFFGGYMSGLVRTSPAALSALLQSPSAGIRSQNGVPGITGSFLALTKPWLHTSSIF